MEDQQRKKSPATQVADREKARPKAQRHLSLPLMTQEGKKSRRKVALPEALFDGVAHEHVLTLALTAFRHRARQGTAKAKEKGEITASTGKVSKQKGLGKARRGSVKSGILRGGVRVFGPRPRQYGFQLNKRDRKLAYRSAFAFKAQKGQVVVVKDFALPDAKTKGYAALAAPLGLHQERVLWVLPKVERNMVLASRNVPKHQVATVDTVNAYDLCRATRVLLFESSLPLLAKKFA